MRALLAGLLFLVAGAAAAQAQVGTCTVGQRPGAADAIVSNAGQPNQVAIVFLAVITCPDGRRMLADTATHSAASGIIEMYGRVEITDPERIMHAGRATYYQLLGQLNAQQNVVVTQRDNGSVIRADNLTYHQQTADRPQSLMVAYRQTGPPARAILFRAAPEPGEPRDSTIVDAHEIRIEGEELFRATGEAVLTRDSLRATAHQIEYHQQSGDLQVLGGGVVTLPSYQLHGDSITAMMGADEQIEEVLTRHGSQLRSDEMEVTAPAIRLFFANSSVNRMVAMTWRPRENVPPDPRPRAHSEQYRMEADSLDVLAPEQQITEAAAIGSAYVERITPDSLQQYMPEAADEVMRLIENDWMRGDTVRAFFVAGPAADTALADAAAQPDGTDLTAVTPAANGGRVMERLTAYGGPAQAMHRVRSGDDPDGKLSIAYLVGRMVDVAFADGVVSVVTASDDVRGIYLQPSEAARRAAAADPERSQ